MKNKKTMLSIREYVTRKALGLLGLIDTDINPDQNNDYQMFINDYEKIQKSRIHEYNLWYNGNSDELLAFYTQQNMIEYNYEPYFDRNKSNYFWAISSTEGNFKRTHSGQPRNIVDTLVNIIGKPAVTSGTEEATKKLEKIFKINNFTKMLIQRSRPLTLVEGWGCYRIDWNTSLSNMPIIKYYRAENVDFVYKSNILASIIFKDYYYDGDGKKYLLIETRTRSTCKEEDENTYPCLIIDKELFRCGDGDSLIPMELTDLPQLEDVKAKIKVSNYSGMLAVPNIYYEDAETNAPGRSIYTGKIDLFDDLDLCLSQSSNTIRKSTPHEYFVTDFLERDRDTGMPIMPKAFDRTYTMVNSPKDANGVTAASEPVMVTQPKLDTTQYQAEAQHILLQMINGVISPATLGIDIAKKDNAEAQREKEKVTIFTRDTIIAEETETITQLAKECLCAEEFIRTGHCTFEDYDIHVQYNEYANSSFESKSQALVTVYNAGVMSPERFIEMMWGDTLDEKSKQAEIDFIKKSQNDQMAMAMGAQGGMGGGIPEMMGDFGMMGADGGGYNALMAEPGPTQGVNMPPGTPGAGLDPNDLQ